MAATIIRQTIKEESPLILQAATEATMGAAGGPGVGSSVGMAVKRAAVAAAEGAEGVAARDSSVLTSHLSSVRQSATHLPSPGTSTLLDGTVHPAAAAPQPTLITTATTTITTTTGAVNPSLLTSSIAHEALSTSSRRTAAASCSRNGTTLSAQLDLDVAAQTTSTIREAVSNAVQEGIEEQLDKAMDMHRLVGGAGPTVAGAAV